MNDTRSQVIKWKWEAGSWFFPEKSWIKSCNHFEHYLIMKLFHKNFIINNKIYLFNNGLILIPMLRTGKNDKRSVFEPYKADKVIKSSWKVRGKKDIGAWNTTYYNSYDCFHCESYSSLLLLWIMWKILFQIHPFSSPTDFISLSACFTYSGLLNEWDFSISIFAPLFTSLLF